MYAYHNCLLYSKAYELQQTLKPVQTIECAPPDVLCLSLDWSNRLHPESCVFYPSIYRPYLPPHLYRNDDSLVVSLSNGEIFLIKPRETGYALAARWSAHEYEPWVAAWDYWDRNIVYSGTSISCSFIPTHALLSLSTLVPVGDSDPTYLRNRQAETTSL